MPDAAVPVERPSLGAMPISARGVGPFGVVVFLASDVMLFAPFFAAYFVLRASNDPWPPAGVELETPRAAIATVVLVASSFTLLAADRAAEHAGGAAAQRRWLLVTVALGAAFLANQIVEYATLDFGADSHPYGSAYWMLTGLHSAHVASGLVAMMLLFVRSARGAPRSTTSSWTVGVSLFWHLVDVIWVVVFLTIWVVR
ncbi:MAG: cytochrome c oxidase subunit 3 [Ilumatobacteraceae bacterium]